MTDHLNDEQLNILADGMRLHPDLASDDPLRAHIERCSQCRDRFGRLVKMLSVAESMPRRAEPPDDLWPSIRARIQEGGRPSHTSTPHIQPWYARDRRRVVLAAAAGAFLAVALGTFVRTRLMSHAGSTPDSVAAATQGTEPVVPVSATEDSANLRAEEDLMAALELRRRTLRPSTSAQIDSSLRVIDMAIAELEAARNRDPNNPAIRQLLASSRARKLELLKQAQNAS